MLHRVACPAPELLPATRRDGTASPPSATIGDVNCDACRQALSARLDGEEEPADRAAVDGHLDACDECGRWYDDAAAVTRLARTAAVVPVAIPGLAAAVLDAAPSPWRFRMARALRWVLGGLGVAQVLLGMTQIATLAGQPHTHAGQVASAGHLWHESAAWNLAVGAGFAWIAVRRTRPSSVVPMLSVFVGVLTVLSVGDLAGGQVTAGWLLSHGVILAGYAVIVLLTRPTFDFGEPPAGRGAGRWSVNLDEPAAQPDAAGTPDTPRLRVLPRPTPPRRDVARHGATHHDAARSGAARRQAA